MLSQTSKHRRTGHIGTIAVGDATRTLEANFHTIQALAIIKGIAVSDAAYEVVHLYVAIFIKSFGSQQISKQEAPTITFLRTKQQPRACKASTRFPRSQLCINCHIPFHNCNVVGNLCIMFVRKTT